MLKMVKHLILPAFEKHLGFDKLHTYLQHTFSEFGALILNIRAFVYFLHFSYQVVLSMKQSLSTEEMRKVKSH